MIRFSFLGACLLFSISLYCQNNKTEKHPIDIKTEHCLEVDSNQNTAGMIDCELVAAGDWDKELNKYYKQLASVLSADEKSKLKTAQLKWIEYRDKEYEFSDLMHNNLEGSMYRIVLVNRRTEIIKQRALELREYYETINGSR